MLTNTNRKANIVDMKHIGQLDEHCRLNNDIIQKIKTSTKGGAWGLFKGVYAGTDYNVHLTRRQIK